MYVAHREVNAAYITSSHRALFYYTNIHFSLYHFRLITAVYNNVVLGNILFYCFFAEG